MIKNLKYFIGLSMAIALSTKIVFAQSILRQKYNCPIKDGTVFYKDLSTYPLLSGDPDGKFFIRGVGNTVLSIGNGRIVNVGKIYESDSISIVVLKVNNLFISYLNLSNVSVKKSDTVSRGQKIGTYKDKELEIQLFDGQKLLYNPRPYLNCKCRSISSMNLNEPQ